MKTIPLLIAVATAGSLAAGWAHAQSPSQASQRRAPPTDQSAQSPEPPKGDTHVHRFFQAWGRGMEKADRAVDKAMPKPDHRWPGTATRPKPTDGSPTGGATPR